MSVLRLWRRRPWRRDREVGRELEAVGYAVLDHVSKPREKRQSIEPTYDHRETGDRFEIETWVGGNRVSTTSIRDPFVTHRLVIGWPDLLRGLLRRRLEVRVLLSGDRGIVEDVCELDADYAGTFGSTRRDAWRQEIEGALSRSDG